MAQEIVKFNVGGHRYEVSRSLLSLHPNTMIAKSASEQWQNDPQKEVFIDRDGAIFSFVLSYLRDGKVALPTTVRKVTLMDELDYYGVDDVEANMIDDENRETKFACNVKSVRDAAILHGIVAACINEFMSIKGSPKSFTHKNSSGFENFDWIVTNCASDPDKTWTLMKLNEHFHKVGLNALNIYRFVEIKRTYCVTLKLLG